MAENIEQQVQDNQVPEQGNPIYKFMKSNNLTKLDEKAFLDIYSKPEKAKEVHDFMLSNKLTNLDESKFYDTYFKKKEQPAVFEKPSEIFAKSFQSDVTKKATPTTSELGVGEEAPIVPSWKMTGKQPLAKEGTFLTPTTKINVEKQEQIKQTQDEALNNTAERRLKARGIVPTEHNIKYEKIDVNSDIKNGILSYNPKTKTYQRDAGAIEGFLRGFNRNLINASYGITKGINAALGNDNTEKEKQQKAELESIERDPYGSMLHSLNIFKTDEDKRLLEVAKKTSGNELSYEGIVPSLGGLAGDIAYFSPTNLAAGLPKIGAALAMGYAKNYGERSNEIYNQLKNEGYNDEDAAKKASIDATGQAIPHTIFEALLFGGAIPHAKPAKDFLASVGQMAKRTALFSAANAPVQGLDEAIKEFQGYDTTGWEGRIKDAVFNGMGIVALMEGLPILAKLPKYAKSAFKEYANNPEVRPMVDEFLKTQPNGEEIKQQLDNYKVATEPLRGIVPDEKMASIGGLQEQRNNINAEIDFANESIKNLEQGKKDSSPGLANKYDELIKKQQETIAEKQTQIDLIDKKIKTFDKSGNPIEQEVDDATGQTTKQENDITQPIELSPELPEGYELPKKPTEVKPEIILSGLNEGFKAVSYSGFDVRSSSEVMNHINNQNSFAEVIDYKGKKYAVVGLRLETARPEKTTGRDNYSFAVVEINETTPKNIIEILENSAKENFKDIYKDFNNKDVVKPITVKNPELKALETQSTEVTTAPVATTEVKTTAEVTPTETLVKEYIENIEKVKSENPEMFWSVDRPFQKEDGTIDEVKLNEAAKEGRLIKTESGFGVVSEDGDIKGVFKADLKSPEKTGDKVIQEAIKAGGIKLDNFALPNLMKIYERNGFREVSRLPFNKDFAPEGWTEAQGTPDVVAMIYDPQNKLSIEKKNFTDYDEAMKYRDSYIEKAKLEKQTEIKAEPKTVADTVADDLFTHLGIEPEVKEAEKLNWTKQQEGVKETKISARNPITTEAAKDLKEGKITSEEYRAIVSDNSPVTPVTKFFDPATAEQVENSVDANKKQNANKPIDENKKVALRIDIPAFRNNNIWVISVHDGLKKTGEILSYKNAARITDVVFGTQSPKASLEIAAGGQKNATVGRIFGEWKNFEGKTEEQKGENAKKLVEEIANDPSWVQVGMNPFRHSYFYDRSSDLGRPVLSAKEVVQIGGLVYAKDVVYGDWNSEAFKVKGMLDKAGKPVYFQLEKSNKQEPKEPIKPSKKASAKEKEKYEKDLEKYKKEKALYDQDLEAISQANQDVKDIFDRAEIENNQASNEPITLTETEDKDIPTQKIEVSSEDKRPEASVMSKMMIKMGDWIQGAKVALGMSDTLRTGEREVVELDENGQKITKTIRDEGGIGFPFKSLMDLINGKIEAGKKAMGWAAVGEGAGTAMINAAKKSKKISGKELKEHYFKTLDLTPEQKQRIEDAIPDNKEYGLVTIYKMGEDGIKSNEAFSKEAFRLMDVKLTPEEKAKVFEIAANRLDKIEWGKDGVKEKYIDKLKNAKTFEELEFILNGEGSDMSLGTKAEIMQKIFLGTEKTTSTEKVNPLSTILKDKGITIESISKTLEEPIMTGIDAGQPMILLAINPEGKVVEDKQRHANYSYGVEGFPIGLFKETSQMHHLSPEMMDTFIKTATVSVDENVSVRGAKEKARISISHDRNGNYIAEIGRGATKVQFTDKKGVFTKTDGKFYDSKGKPIKATAKPLILDSKEALSKELQKQGYTVSEASKKEYTQQISGSNISYLMQKAKVGIINFFKNPEITAQQKLVKYINKSFPNIEIVLDAKEYKRIEQDFKNKKLLNVNQETFGVVDGDTGKIFLNPTLLNNNTPVHELGHVWNAYAKEYKPEIYNKGIELITNTENSKYFDSVLNNNKYQKLIKDLFGDDALIKDKETGTYKINESHKDFKEIKEYISDEALSKAIGDKGELFVNEAQKRDFKKWLTKLYNAVKQIVGFESMSADQFQNLNLKSFVDAAIKDILGGKKISEFTSKDLAELTKTKPKFELGESESQDAKIKDFIEMQRKKGILDEDIRAGLEKAADRIGLDKNKIDELLTTKKEEYAVQKPSPEGVLQPTQEGAGEAGGKRTGMEQAEQGAIPPKEGKPSEAEVGGAEEEVVSGLTKAELSKYDAAKTLFESEGKTTWNEVVDNSVKKLIKDNPNTTVEKAAQNHVDRLSSLYDEGRAINPTAEDLAIIALAKLNVEKQLSDPSFDLNSDDISERNLAVAEFDRLNQELIKIAKATNPREAGLAFGIRQMLLSTKNGLEIRRMELMKNKGGEKLTDAEMTFTREQWAKEKKLMQEQSELKEKKMQEDFDAALKLKEKEYQDLLAKRGAVEISAAKAKSRQEVLKQKGKDLANKLRSNKQSGFYSDPFLVGKTLNFVLDTVADLVEAGADLASAIDKFVSDNRIQSRRKMVEDAIFDHLNRQEKRSKAIDAINEITADTEAKNITKDMVLKNAIKDFVDSYVNTVELNQVSDVAFKKLKELLPNITKDQFKQAYLKVGEFKIEKSSELKNQATEQQRVFNRMTNLENQLAELKKKNDLLKDGDSKKEAVQAEIQTINQKIQSELTASGRKVSSTSSLAKEGYEKRSNEHDKNIDEVVKDLTKQAEGLTGKEKDLVDEFLGKLDNSKIDYDPASKLNQSSKVENATEKIDLLEKQLDVLKKSIDKDLAYQMEMGLQKIKDRFNSTKEEVNQSVMLEQAKKDALNRKKEFERKIVAKEFDDTVPKKTLTKTDAELIENQAQLATVKSAYDKLAEKYRREKRTALEVVLETGKSIALNTLIGMPKTFFKLAIASPAKIAQTYLSKAIFGKLAELSFNKGIIQRAKEGGESSSFQAMNEGLKQVFSHKTVAELEKSSEKDAIRYTDSATKYENAIAETKRILDEKGENSKEYKNALEKQEKLRIQSQAALKQSVGNTIGQYIGGSTLKTMWEKLIKRNSQYEKAFGDFNSEDWTKVNNWKHVADNINYIFGFVGRSHGALKSISARYHFGVGFMARLEAALEKGEDITDFQKLKEIASDSYTDWESGMYQQENWVTGKTNKIIDYFKRSDVKAARVIGNLASWDVAITKVPVNMINEAIVEMTLGLPISLTKYTREYIKASKIAKAEVPLRLTEAQKADYKAAIQDTLSKMDKRTAVAIVRCFRHGGFGLGIMALAVASGAVKFGGFPHLGQKKEDEKKRADELKTAEIELGDTKLNEYISGALEHTTSLFPTLTYLAMQNDWAKGKRKGLKTYENVSNLTVNQLEHIVNSYPQSKIFNPVTVSKEIYKMYSKAGKKAVEEYSGGAIKFEEEAKRRKGGKSGGKSSSKGGGKKGSGKKG